MSGARRGILGGTFDPVHFAHLAIAEQAREQFGLDRIVFVPAGQTVHKEADSVTPAKHRARMLQLAVEGNPAFGLDLLEIERGGPSYTVDTLAALAAGEPGVEWHFIVSAEAARELPGWREPRRILELARLVIVPRLGYETPEAAWLAAQLAAPPDRFLFAQATALGHSASDIRRRVATGRSIRYLVPDAVRAYIARHGLYKGQ